LYFDYKPVPLIFEVSQSSGRTGIRAMPLYKNARVGSILEGEGGDISESAAYDNDGKRIERFEDRGGGNHLGNFIEAVRNNRPDKVACPIEDSHLSSALCHFGNISYRIGQTASPQEIAEWIKDNAIVGEAWERCRENLKINGVPQDNKNAGLGAALTIDNAAEKVSGTFADAANAMLRRTGRGSWVVPEIV
jgi:hypothetical protein